MREIWKYQLEIPDIRTIKIPKGALILTVQVQKGIPCVWVLVNPTAPTCSRHFRIVGTGHPFNDAAQFPLYVGTFQMLAGDCVFHVFCDGEAEEEVES